MKKTIIFDLDGTLVDIEPFFFSIFNDLAPIFGYAPILQSEVPKLKLLPLKTLLRKRLGWRIIFFPWIIGRGRREYHRLVSKVALFPKIVELLSTLRSQGYSIGIVSSSKQETTAALLKKFQLSVDFSYQCTLFNKAKVLKQVLSEKNLSVTDVIYVGDEVRDIEACQKIGLPIIAVTWGLNSKEALQHTGVPTADTREALLAMLLT